MKYSGDKLQCQMPTRTGNRRLYGDARKTGEQKIRSNSLYNTLKATAVIVLLALAGTSIAHYSTENAYHKRALNSNRGYVPEYWDYANSSKIMFKDCELCEKAIKIMGDKLDYIYKQ